MRRIPALRKTAKKPIPLSTNQPKTPSQPKVFSSITVIRGNGKKSIIYKPQKPATSKKFRSI